MNKTLGFLISCTAPLAFASAAAVAQEQTSSAPAATATATTTTATASVTAGATVYDAAGVEVGTIKSVDATNFVIDTGKNTATMALSTLSAGAKGPVLGLTREQLDAAAEKAGAEAAAALSASLVTGAEVRASDGTTVLGKVGEVTETNFVLDTGKARVKLPKTSVAKGESGLLIGMTAEQFADAARSASGKKGSK